MIHHGTSYGFDSKYITKNSIVYLKDFWIYSSGHDKFSKIYALFLQSSMPKKFESGSIMISLNPNTSESWNANNNEATLAIINLNERKILISYLAWLPSSAWSHFSPWSAPSQVSSHTRQKYYYYYYYTRNMHGSDLLGCLVVVRRS